MRPRVVSALAVIGACAHAEPTRVEGWTYHRDAAPVERLIVFVHRESMPFADAIVGGLRRCGVTAKVVYRDPLAFGPGATTQAAFDAVKPSATLEVRRTGGVVDRYDEYAVSMRELASEREIWKASAHVTAETTDAAFAETLVARLDADGRLAACPKGGAS